ncbi:dihydrolipoyl dehydrogenase [Clostridium sp. MCC353]|uniref:dihydrolipoyl dehydrogenase n=1 Tax=Clostridium sp. MCC353 TaxID=2592646 RepID=UPI001C02F65F|nr:dihydrolipoyl dehydrogenase [Clostridium sp. MCC353]MBT9777972.1 dihydrolipoyl dehydrogenase [Clostridium sp. MCC353]
MAEQFDLIVIGAGPGGYIPALKAAGLGKKTAVIEAEYLGGTCLNKGCIPTKSLLHAGELYREMGNADRFGISGGGYSLNGEAVWNYKDRVVSELRNGISQSLKKVKIEVIKGRGKITGEKEVTVFKEGGEELVITGEKILIAAGSSPAVPPIAGAKTEGVVDSDGILNGDGTIYPRLVIIGGGVIGMEMATVYSDFGSRVTVIEAMDRILPGMDKEISQNLKMIMKKRGVEIHTSAAVKEICKTEDGLVCRFEEKGQELEITADRILISIGRKPNAEGLFSESMEPCFKKNRGYLAVDGDYETSVKGIYAIGDVIGGIQLAHVATAEGCRAVEAMFGLPFTQKLETVPSCVYTSPEIACVGMTADQAKENGIAVKTGKYIMSVNGKSVLTMQERGFIKLVAEAESKKIIGAQLMCARATDMIGELELAVNKGLTAADLAEVMMPHPTFCEGIGEAALELIEK